MTDQTPTQDNTAALQELCALWCDTKKDENRAAAARAEIEAKIVAITGHKPKGATTVKIPGFKTTVTGVLNTKMDWAKWEAVKAQFPENLRPVKFKPELDEPGVTYLAENHPDLYTLLPITVTPGKTSVKVEPVLE